MKYAKLTCGPLKPVCRCLSEATRGGRSYVGAQGQRHYSCAWGYPTRTDVKRTQTFVRTFAGQTSAMRTSEPQRCEPLECGPQRGGPHPGEPHTTCADRGA
jgi:hypothetical protein